MPRKGEYVSVSMPVELRDRVMALRLPLNVADGRRKDSLATRVEFLIEAGAKQYEGRPPQADLVLYDEAGTSSTGPSTGSGPSR